MLQASSSRDDTTPALVSPTSAGDGSVDSESLVGREAAEQSGEGVGGGEGSVGDGGSPQPGEEVTDTEDAGKLHSSVVEEVLPGTLHL